jgi:hypothetical protein
VVFGGFGVKVFFLSYFFFFGSFFFSVTILSDFLLLKLLVLTPVKVRCFA